jgi:hypothetical protein
MWPGAPTDYAGVGIKLKRMLFGLLLLIQAGGLHAAAAGHGSSSRSSGTARAEELRAARRKNLSVVKPAKASKVAAFLATAEADGLDPLITVQYGNFRIGFGKISPISSLTPAIRYERPRIGQTEVSLRSSGASSLRGYHAFDFQFGRFDIPAPYDFLGAAYLGAPFEFDRRSQRPNQHFLYADARYRNFPREDFYGLGPGSLEGSLTEYRLEEVALHVVGGYQAARWLGIQARAGYLRTDVGEGNGDERPDVDDVFNDTTAPGLTHQPDFFHLDSGVYLGWESDPNLPSALLGLRYAWFEDRKGDRFDFNRFSVDARGYLPLGSRQRVFAVRFYTSSDNADEGSQVPFYLMKTLGGHDTLRGYRDFRFRDANLIYLSGEYRWEANAAVELAVFYDTGKTVPDRAALSFDGLKHSFGAGIRAKNMRRILLRIDVGHSEDGTFLLFAFGPSF